jgi:plasmid stability protein
MDKLLKLLGVEKLDESAQTDIKEKLQSIIEVKAKELSEEKVKEKEESLIELYEEKFETYKEEITSKFSNFIDSILEEEMVIPENILEYARKGELYDDLIEQFKVRLAIDEGLVDEEARNLLKEAKDEIEKLREDVDSLTEEKLEIQKDAQEMASEIYLRKKCEGLTESQKDYVFEMLGGIVDKDEIDRKFDIVVEASNDENTDEKSVMNEEGEGITEPESEKNINEENDDSPFKKWSKMYLNVLKENKI